MCQSQLCTTPTNTPNWRFTGVAWFDPKTKHSHPPIPRLLCNDCAFRIMTTMAPSLHNNEANMQSMILNKYTLHCTTCFTDFRLSLAVDDPVLINNLNNQTAYCPNCGHYATKRRDPTLDFWELIAEELSLNVELTRMLYDGWLHDRQFTTFREYVQAMEDEVAQATHT